MLILNINLPTKENDWVLLDTENGTVAITAFYEGNQMRLAIEAPKSVKIVRKSIMLKNEAKTKENEDD